MGPCSFLQNSSSKGFVKQEEAATPSHGSKVTFTACVLKKATWLQHEEKRWTAPNQCSAPVVQGSSLMGSIQTPLLPSLPSPKEDIGH